MEIYRIWAIVMRHLVPTLREEYRLIDLLYWPFLDIIIWGFTGAWMQSIQPQPLNVSLMLLTALFLWQIANRAQLEISLSLIEEFWSRNMVNLFATPLHMSEWITATMILGIIKSCVTALFGGLAIWWLYGISIVSFGWTLVWCSVSLIVSGWIFGFLTSAILITAGQRVQTLVWALPWLAAPFSAVYYPVAVLPWWAQKIAWALPMTYIFEGIREITITGSMPHHFWHISSALNIFYCTCAILLFITTFYRSKQYGLARLEVE